MIVTTRAGTAWHILDPNEKLANRASLPGAYVYDLTAESLRRAKAKGVSAGDRFNLALSASWLVNSPAPSRVLRRWSRAPSREVWLDLVERLDELSEGPRPWPPFHADMTGKLAALGREPYAIEAVSKVLALLVPDVVPLMPAPAVRLFLGTEATQTPDTFVTMVEWFAHTIDLHRRALESVAEGHTEVTLTAAQVLDRLLWFDSEGHVHFDAKTRIGQAPP